MSSSASVTSRLYAVVRLSMPSTSGISGVSAGFMQAGGTKTRALLHSGNSTPTRHGEFDCRRSVDLVPLLMKMNQQAPAGGHSQVLWVRTHVCRRYRYTTPITPCEPPLATVNTLFLPVVVPAVKYPLAKYTCFVALAEQFDLQGTYPFSVVRSQTRTQGSTCTISYVPRSTGVSAGEPLSPGCLGSSSAVVL